MASVGRGLPGLIGLAVALAAGPAWGQSNIDAGKTPAQIFSDTCNACHRSPRELKPTSAGYLREHYTTGGREAAAMAAYLASVGSDPRAVQQRRPPALGAGQAPAAETRPPQPVPSGAATDQAKPPETQAALPGANRRPAEQARTAPGQGKPRRPSESVEAGISAAAGAAEGVPSQTAAGPRQGEEFEE